VPSNSCGLLAFSVLGPILWNSLPRLLRYTSHNTTSFGHSLKTYFSQSTSAYSALGAFAIMHYTNPHFTHSLSHCDEKLDESCVFALYGREISLYPAKSSLRSSLMLQVQVSCV